MRGRWIAAVIICVGVLVLGSLGGISSVGAEPASRADRLVTEHLAAFPGGTRIGNSQIAYEDGKVILHVVPMNAADCPNGWLCLWDRIGNTGRMVQFQSAGTWLNLANYGFDNAARSWRNRTSRTAYLREVHPGQGAGVCMAPGVTVTSMGSFNGRASSLRLSTAETQC